MSRVRTDLLIAATVLALTLPAAAVASSERVWLGADER